MGTSFQDNQRSSFSHLIDPKVLASATIGVRNAQAEIYNVFANSVHTLAYGISRDQHIAEDICHNTFIKAFKHLSTFKEQCPFGFWLRKIAVNESLMFLRKQSKWQYLSEWNDELEVNSLRDSDELSISTDHDLDSILKLLPDEVRYIVWLKEIEGFTHDEISIMFNKSPSYSKSIVSRAYQKIRKCLADSQVKTKEGIKNACYD